VGTAPGAGGSAVGPERFDDRVLGSRHGRGADAASPRRVARRDAPRRHRRRGRLPRVTEKPPSTVKASAVGAPALERRGWSGAHGGEGVAHGRCQRRCASREPRLDSHHDRRWIDRTLLERSSHEMQQWSRLSPTGAVRWDGDEPGRGKARTLMARDRALPALRRVAHQALGSARAIDTAIRSIRKVPRSVIPISDRLVFRFRTR